MNSMAQQLQTARETLAPVAGELAPLEARILAQHAWGVKPELIVRDADLPMAKEKVEALEVLVARRLTREPIAQILGMKHFWKDDFVVTRDVLTPRADSETIIEQALKYANAPVSDILDLGTGSGCLLLSLLAEFPQARGVGVDASPAALNIARRNAHNTLRANRCDFLGGEWLRPLEKSAQFDIVVSNPPYIPTRDIARLMSDVRDHEPHMALDGGTDGLDCYRSILAQVKPHMRPNALLLFEVGVGQADDVASHAVAQGFAMVAIAKDLSGIDRVVVLKNNQE